MKKYISIAFLAAIFAVVSPECALAQWDYNSHVIDNIISSRIDRRKTAARIRARKAARKRPVKRKYNRQKARRVSQIEGITIPKLKLNADLPKRIEIA